VIFFYFFIPEMKGRSLEELDEMFMAKVSVRNFRNYQCQLKEDAVNDVMQHKLTGEEKEGAAAHAEEVEVDRDGSKSV
jgi:hypothetical protein